MSVAPQRERVIEVGAILPPTAEENERLTRVGAGTPMGEMMRRYWQPACLASEIPNPDDPPVRVRLLGEDLVAYRDSSGEVGLVDAYCAHRRAPLFFGRNEECGLRCVYHGWKYDTTGQCVDLPSEPEFSHMREHVKIKAYPTHEAGGLIWTYMGPREQQPPVPEYEWLRVPETHFKISKAEMACNYLQSLEGGIDTAHSSFLHNDDLSNPNLLRSQDKHPHLDVDITDYGFVYCGIRNVNTDQSYLRAYQFIMPIQKLQGSLYDRHGDTERAVPFIYGHLWAPIDDENCFMYSFRYASDSVHGEWTQEMQDKIETFQGFGPEDFIPGTFRLRKNASNDYMIDRELQRTKTYTGLVGSKTQDVGIQEGMGPIEDRSLEYLGTTDMAIIACRQLLLEAAADVEEGLAPKGLDPATSRGVRGTEMIVARGVPWRDAMKEALIAIW